MLILIDRTSIDMSSSRNTSTTSSTSTTMRLSGAVVAVLAASAVSYYYQSNIKKTKESTTSTSRDITSATMEFENDPNNSTNRLSRWQERWSTGRTQWHKTETHASLLKYCDEYLLDGIIGGGGRILVPLCGKTVDMVYLTRKRAISEVVGIDAVPKALDEFMEEQSSEELDFQEPETVNGYTKRKGNSITLITGDFLDITLDVINGGGGGEDADTSRNTLLFDGVWDRGSLVAIDPSLREQYVDKIGELMIKPNGKYLLSTVVRPNNDTTTGPPFSIDETEIRRLFGTKPWVNTITLLDSHSFLALEPWYKVIMTYLRLGNIKEEIYFITTR
jgi:thiopurine S-methyltransferase